MAGSLQNWYRALCAPEGDVAWKGLYDPAYQPQQMALTAGFMCIVACDLNSRAAPDLARFASTSEAPQLARDAVCNIFPWKGKKNQEEGAATDFSKAATAKELAVMTQGLPCPCEKMKEDGGGKEG